MRSKKLLILTHKGENTAVLQEYLAEAGYGVQQTELQAFTEELLHADSPDFIVINAGGNLQASLDCCKCIRRLSTLPVLLLRAQLKPEERVAALVDGADFCIDAGWKPQEILALIQALLRRIQMDTVTDCSDVSYRDLHIENDKEHVVAFGREVFLRPREKRLLHYLARHPNTVLSREQLLLVICGSRSRNKNLVSTYIEKLREKLQIPTVSSWNIETVWKKGYRFNLE